MVGHGEVRVCSRRRATDHGRPEHPPRQDAVHGDELDQALGRAQPRVLGAAACLQDVVKHLDFPAPSIPIQFLDGLLGAVHEQVGDQPPVDRWTILRRFRLTCVQDGE